MERLGLTVLGVAYCGLLLAFVARMRLLGPQSNGAWGVPAIASLVIVVKVADVGAYSFGRLLGRHKMSPVLSPGKTWEGLVAGTIVAILVPFFALYHQHFLTVGEALALGVVIAISAPLGDLFESAVKRDMNAKDSGRLLGGHGGMLDRVDALLFASVASYYLVRAFGWT